MKSGDRYESPSGLGFVITAVTKKEITVEIDRVVLRNGKKQLDVKTRVVPIAIWPSFSRAYRKVGK